MIWRFLLFLPCVIAYKCISMYGLETPDKRIICSWVHDEIYYLDRLKKLGFDTIRLPFSMSYYNTGDLTIMDRIIDYCEHNDMNIILDLHRIEGNFQEPTPFYNGKTTDDLIDMWLSILNRYDDKISVIGHNIYNEYIPSEVEPLLQYSKEVIEQVELIFKGRFIHFITGTNWSGSLRDVNKLEEILNCGDCINRLVYSVHKYPFSANVYDDKEKGIKDWDNSFGDIGIPSNKLIIGEFGWEVNQNIWANNFIDYLIDKNITNTCYWSISQSGDVADLFHDDCNMLVEENYVILQRLWRCGRNLR